MHSVNLISYAPNPGFAKFAQVRALAILLTFFVLACGLGAQSVHWEPDRGTLTTGKFEELSLVFENCAPKDEPQVPKVTGLTLVMRGSQQNISMVNFKVTKTIAYTFAARLERKESVTIPAFAIETDQGRQNVPAASFDPGEATVGKTAVSIEDIAQAKFLTPLGTVWAGEVFPLTYRLDVVRRYYHQIAGHPEWNATPLVIEEWAKPEGTDTKRGRDTFFTVTYKTRAYAKEPGAVSLNQATQLVNIQTGVVGGFLMGQGQLEQIVVNSDQPVLNVRPLPSPAPTAFNGAVGQFKFVSKVVPEKAKVGDPITWTLELSGTGNWPDIPGLPQRSVSKSFEVIQPQAKRSIAENKLFEGTLTEDVVLMPKKPGSYALGPVSFSYFDPSSGSYKTVTTDKVTVTILDASKAADLNVGNPTPENAGASNSPSSSAERSAIKLQAPPSGPTPIPTDPSSGTSRAALPLSPGVFLTLLLAPVLFLLTAWGLLSYERAIQADPGHLRRLAGKRLKKTLRDLAASGYRTSLIHAWQRDTARYLGLFQEAPIANAIEGLASVAIKSRRKPDYAAWAKLWREADEVLYSPSAKLPEDWIHRAQALFAATRAPLFPAHRILAPRNLMPWWFAAVLLFTALIPSPLLKAISQGSNPSVSATEAYASGDFAAAADAWRDAVSKEPTDWRARHNLGIALLQQGKHNEAVAQLAAAFVQNPRNESTQLNFLVAMEHAGFAPQSIGALANNNPSSELTRLASPFEWQLLLVGACLLAALALGLALRRGYGLRTRWLKPGIFTLLALSVLLAIASLVSLHHYGAAVDRKAALVWQSATLRSIPTEADSTQKTSALPAGSLAIVDKTFLGWRHLSFPGGESGWVREDDLVMLWR